MYLDNPNKTNLVGVSRWRARDNTELVKYAESRMDFCGSVWGEGFTNFPKLQDRLNIMGARMVTQRKLHTEDPQILDTN